MSQIIDSLAVDGPETAEHSNLVENMVNELRSADAQLRILKRQFKFL